MTSTDTAQIDAYRDSILSGQTFRNHALGHRSRYGYKPPINRRQYAQVMRVMAKMAEQSDAMAKLASAIIPKINLYGDRAQVCAAIYEAAAAELAKGYLDVIRLAGPEPGRRSDAQSDYTLYQRVSLHYYLLDATRGMTDSLSTAGWCLQAVAQEIRYTHREVA